MGDGDGGGGGESARRPTMRGPGAPPRRRSAEADQALLDRLRGIRERGVERETERHVREPEPAPRTAPRRSAPARPDRAADEGTTAREQAILRELERGTGPVLPVPWESAAAPEPPPPPLESMPPETVTSDPANPAPRSYAPPQAYYTPAEPPQPPPPPLPMSRRPPPMSLAPEYSFEEAIRIAAAWEAERSRERARRRLEFAHRYGTGVPLILDGPDGPAFVAPDAPRPRAPDEVARDVILGTWDLTQEGSSALTGLSEELRDESLQAADDIHLLFDPLRDWIREHRTELVLAEIVLGVPRLADTALDLIDFLQNALSLLMGIGTGLMRAALELLPGIVSLLQLLYNLLQLLLLEDIARAEEERERIGEHWEPGEHFPSPALLPLELTPARRRLLEERRRWARELRDGVREALDTWRAEYDTAGPDRRSNMIGQLIGQVIAVLLTARAAGPRAVGGGGGAGSAAAAAERVPGAIGAIVELGADGTAVTRPTLALPSVSELADRLGVVLEQAGPPPALAVGGAVLMSAPPGESPPSPAATARGNGSRSTGGSSRGTSERHPLPPRPDRAPRRRLSRAARRRLQERLTAVEVEAWRRVRLLEELTAVRRQIEETFGEAIPDTALWRRLRAREAALLRRLGRRELGSGTTASEQLRLSTQGLIRTIRELRRSARAMELDDAALRAVEDLDLEDHLAISTSAHASRGGHFRGYPVRHEPVRGPDLSPLDRTVMRRTRSGVISNPAGAIGERIGQRTADPVARAWARDQARRLGHTGEPLRGRLYAYRRAVRDGEEVFVRTEIGDPGAFVAADGDRLSLLVYAESKTSRQVAAQAVTEQTEAALTRAHTADYLEFVADDGQVIVVPGAGLSSGDHTMLITHGVRDSTVLDFADNIPGGLGTHRHNVIPLTHAEVRDLASHYTAAIPESRALPPPADFQPVPQLRPPETL
ncbi:hypothetical protein [Streptomyces sp. NPDC127084]|uniref:hypothetical protein n=1 Tax=Streptomyces sp. NPDC127084 TaxID=3347133 RepID=UPI00366086EA